MALYQFLPLEGADVLGQQIVTAGATLTASPLADRILEPAMPPGANLAGRFGNLIGTGPGVGIALLYVAWALAMVGVALGGY